MTNNKAFAEIIESSLQGFIAQSWQWDTCAPFGSMVLVESHGRLLFGIVHQVQTGSMDSSRYPFPYKKTEQELLQEQPQIFEFLKTTFSCLVIGYQERGRLHYLFAPEPAKIHSFVRPLPVDIGKQFFHNNNYLHLLFSSASAIAAMDELLLAMLAYQATLNVLTVEKVTSFAQTFSLLTGNDYRRLKLFLQRAELLIP
jgi:hypothetical protein